MSRYARLTDYAAAGGFGLPAELQAAVAAVPAGLESDRLVDYQIRDHAEALTADYMRPAYDALLAEVRKLQAETPTTAAQAFYATPAAQANHHKLVVFVARYQAIIAAARMVFNTPTICDYDRRELFLDGTKVAPGKFYSPDVYEPAGPPRTDEFARLLYLAEPDSGAYLASPSERLAAYEHFRQHGVSGAGNFAHDNAMRGDGWRF